MQQLSLFEELEQDKKADEAKLRNYLAQPTKCIFCKEFISKRTFGANNHGIVFNGWCIKALLLHGRNRNQDSTEEASWLRDHGLDVNKSRFDESHWDTQNIKQHYKDHVGQCYLERCDS